MVKQIVRDIFFLGQPSKLATKADIQIGKDLQDTLQATVRWYGCKYDWCKEEYYHCEYGIYRCCYV